MSAIDYKKYVDMQSALDRIRGNKNLYYRLLEMFLKNNVFKEFEEAYAAADYVKAADAMHTIKGVASNISLTLLTEVSTELMLVFRQGTTNEVLVDSYRVILSDTLSSINYVLENKI